MQWISQILFALCLGAGIWFFAGRVRFIRRNILLGKDIDLSDNPAARWKQMFWVAMGQSKMAKRPVAFVFHLFVYLGFVLINIEVLEILLDGLLGTHRLFSFMAELYNVAIGFFEILALLVLVACVVFLARRFVVKVPRLNAPELKGWPVKDATTILIVEIVLMAALLKMNAADQILQSREAEHYTIAGSFPVSQYLVPLMDGFSTDFLIMAERGAWWFHFIGILLFLNYVPYSKHWHIIMSFPNVYYTPLKPKGSFANMESVTTEVKLMMDPSATPPEGYEPPAGFGARDVQDLTWKNLMDAYTCTECGRCSSVCPANLTGKKLSPRKIMMDTRDRLEEVGLSLRKTGRVQPDGKTLLTDYITVEELRACTTCNACVQECPVSISPLDIILELRRTLIMEDS
ncbi:MAG: 4Fe-4S dicluster domain-containing protein, partial [Sphingomonadales bacterium]